MTECEYPDCNICEELNDIKIELKHMYDLWCAECVILWGERTKFECSICCFTKNRKDFGLNE